MSSWLSPEWVCSNYRAWGTSCIAQYGTTNFVLKCLSCYKSIVEITMSAHCFHELVHYTHL